MKALPIDKLLTWCLCEELPKGRPISSSPWDVITEYGRTGRPRERNYDGGFDLLGMTPGAPHPDAEIIGRALADLPGEVRLPEDDCAALLGHYTTIDLAMVKRQAARQRYNLQAALVRGAVLAPPEWNIGLPRPVPWKLAANGRARVHVERDGEFIETPAHPKAGGWWHVIHLAPRCLLDWHEPSIDELLCARAEYAVWWRGLEMLFDALKGRTSEHEALPPSVPPRPWITGAVKPPRVLKGNGAGKMAKLPLKPDRPRALPPLMSESGAKAEKNSRRGNGRRKRESGAAQAVYCGGARL